MQRRLAAEALGTFWLVFGGCGSAVLAAAFPDLGIGFFGVAMAFGLTVLTMAYAVGGISGGHFNPAVTIGLTVAGKSDGNAMIPYIIAQLAGAILAAAALYVIASGKAGVDLGGFAANGYGEHSPGGYSMISGFLLETILTAFFLIVILGSIHGRVPKGFAPVAIGLALTLVASGAIAALSLKHAARRWPWLNDLSRKAPWFSGLLIIVVGIYMMLHGLSGL